MQDRAAPQSHVAVVFGREDRGLLNGELALCHVTCGIPLHTKHPSLNLAQSVMIIAYELSQKVHCNRPEKDAIHPAALPGIQQALHTVCSAAGIDPE